MSAPSSRVIAVAVSGGVDSLAALARLKEEGRPVIAVHGVFAQYLNPDAEPGPDIANVPGRALSPQPYELPPDVRLLDPASLASPVVNRLMEACAALGVPLFVADCSRPFVKKVVAAFVEAYAQGRTPNPCVACNAEIKFGLLLDLAQALGATHLATGHYARLVHEPEAGREDALPGLPALLQGADPLKDQSYFLCLVPQRALALALFPLGETHKSRVVEDMASRGLEVPQPGESQEICFIPDNEYRDFLPRMAHALSIELPGPGPVFLPDLRPLGSHEGLWRYTEGQRRGLGIAWEEPLYVIAKNGPDNSLIVGTRKDMHCWGCECERPNILLDPALWPDEVFVKTRYRQRAVPATARIVEPEPGAAKETRLSIVFAQVEQAVAPGQAAAVYIPVPGMIEEDGRPVLRLVAGGIISERHE